MKSLSGDCNNSRNDAMKVREELRQEQTRRESAESDFSKVASELGTEYK